MFCFPWVGVIFFCLSFIEQKYISTVQKSVKSTEAQRASDVAKNKKLAAKEVSAQVVGIATWVFVRVCGRAIESSRFCALSKTLLIDTCVDRSTENE